MNQLFQLIKSLSPAETAYIKRAAFGSLQRSPKYIEVMEAIRLQESYDEEKLMKQFRREKFVKQFSVMKNYLTTAVLDGLVARQFSDNASMALQLQMAQVKILRSKGLYTSAGEILENALNTAREAEAFLEWLELLAQQRYFIVNKFYAGDQPGLQQNKEETERVLRLYDNYLAYQNINSEQTQLADRSFHIRSEDYLEEHHAVISHPMIADETRAHSGRALFELLMTRVLYYNITDQREAFFEHALRAFELAHSSRWLLQFDKLRLLSTYPQLMHASLLNQQWAVLEQTITRLKNFEPSGEVEQMAAFAYLVPYSLVYHQVSGRPDKLAETIREAYENVKKFGRQLRFDTRSQIIISCMSGCLETGDYKSAIDWAMLFNEYDMGDRIDTRLIVDMMELIAHNELGQMLLVHGLSQAMYQRALRWGEKGLFEDTFIRFFKKINTLGNPEKMDALYRNTMESMGKISEGGIMAQNRTLFPLFEAYVQSRIAGTPYHLFLQTKGKTEQRSPE